MNQILFSSIREVAKKISASEVHPLEILKASSNLIKSTKPLNAYINSISDSAIAEFEKDEKPDKNSTSKGALHGIPIAIKDNFCTKGYPTTCASFMLANFVPGYDATVCTRLKESGAIIIGKTNLDEFAMGSETINSFFGPTKNIWGSQFMNYYCYEDDSISCKKQSLQNIEDWYISGGSSGGSAVAVASGTCFAALGSDTGGSTRNPASYCGLIGLKPTYGLVSRFGLIPLVNSMDVPGILTRRVDDALVLLNTIAGPDPLDSTTFKDNYKPIVLPNRVEVSKLKIGIPVEYRIPELSDEVNDCWKKMACILEEAGAKVIPVSLPHTDLSLVCYYVLNQCEVASNMARYDGLKFGHRANDNLTMESLLSKTRDEGFNNTVRDRIVVGNFFSLTENYENYFIKALKVRRLIRQDFDALWDSGIDLLLTPTTLSDAPIYRDLEKIDLEKTPLQDYFTQPANLAGIPALNIPIGISRKGLPLSLQLMSSIFQEFKLLTVAKWIEENVHFPRLVLEDMRLLN